MKKRKIKPVNTCTHPKWTFKQTKLGVQRKCKRCGLKITDVASGVFGKESIHKTRKGTTLV